MSYSRKDFLKLTGLASASLFVPRFLQGENTSAREFIDRLLLSGTNGKRLIVIQLSGGNDGLNTIVPFGDDLYYNNRPGIGIGKDKVLKMNDHFGFNPAMKALQDLYAQGEFAFVNSVGYPNPNRSHFRSLDIWHSASDADKYMSSGWIGRWLDSCCSGQDIRPHLALELDDTMSLALKGEKVAGIASRNPKRLNQLTSDTFLMGTATAYIHHESDHELVDYLHKTLAETSQSANYLIDHVKTPKAKALYPQHAFGKQMKTIADLVLNGSETAIYYVSLPGFDTHAGQNGQQDRLLGIYAEGIKALSKDLKDGGFWKDTLIVTFSEFGRRVKQNASRGTDHGTANVLMLAGGALNKKGQINEVPDLKNLDNGDLIYKVDFRQVYATVLQNWLGTDPEIVLGRKFGLLDFV